MNSVRQISLNITATVKQNTKLINYSRLMNSVNEVKYEEIYYKQIKQYLSQTIKILTNNFILQMGHPLIFCGLPWCLTATSFSSSFWRVFRLVLLFAFLVLQVYFSKFLLNRLSSEFTDEFVPVFASVELAQFKLRHCW